MQFIVFMIPAVYQPKTGSLQPGADFKPDPKMMEAMGKFNDELRKAGALKGVNGLQPRTQGARLAFAAGKSSVTDGAAIQAGEVVGGYWLVEAKSREQVVEWWKCCPAQDGDVIEIRQIAGGEEHGAGSKEPGSTGGTKGPFKKSRGARTKEQD